jgi:hypothetical protein
MLSLRPLVLLLALPLALSACKDEPPAPPPPSSPVEQGNWEDKGPFATCPVLAGNCGELSTFDMASCSQGTLSGFNPEGAYTVQLRYTRGNNAVFGTTAMALTAGGGPEWLGRRQVVSRQVGPTTVFYRGEDTSGQGEVRSRSYMGCQMPGADHLVGCFDECINGERTIRGSFQARRASPAAGEPESAGLTLVSETRVRREQQPVPTPPSPAGTPVDVYVTKKHAYVVSLNAGLFVYDVEFPERPVFQTQIYYPTDSYWNAVWAHGDALYVASTRRGVLVFDIRDPGAPVLVRSAPTTPPNVHTVFVSGNLLYAAGQEPDAAVLVFDVTNPLQPVLISKFQAYGYSVPQEGDGPHDMFAFEDRLYVNFWGAGYVIADVKRPDDPVELGRYRYKYATSHASAVARYGDRLIAFEGGEDWGAHLRVLDVTDPGNIQLIGEWRLHEHISIHNMVLVGTKLYVAHYQDGVRVLDVSVPETPRQVAHFNTFRPANLEQGTSFYDGAIGIRVPGDGYVYTVDSTRGLLILREP